MNYLSEINNLNQLLKEEKKKNEILSNENRTLKTLITNLKNENNKLKQYEQKNRLLQEEINRKIMEIQNLKVNNLTNSNQSGYLIPSLKPGEKIIAINFVSMGIQDISNYNLICKNTDLFVRLEERLYNEFPNFKNFETYFEVKTKRIKRFKTIEENGIKGNDVISVFIIEE